jgi:hypothetical protein
MEMRRIFWSGRSAAYNGPAAACKWPLCCDLRFVCGLVALRPIKRRKCEHRGRGVGVFVFGRLDNIFPSFLRVRFEFAGGGVS